MPLPFSRRASQTAPSFSRDFAGLKTLDHGVGPAITFTRASNATYFDAAGTLQTAANDTPRFDHDPATGASRGLLIEEARTNLLIRSAEFTDATWTKTNVTATDGQSAPDGTTTADAILETVDSGIHETRQSVSIAATATHTYSVFLKANGRNFVTVYVRETANSGATYASVVVDLSDGSISGSPVGTATVTSVGNGWYRVAVSASIDAGTRFAQIRLREDASTTSYAGDITKGILAWGAQLEAGDFPTSYIPTTSAAVTRAADGVSVTPISSFYNTAEGTMFAEVQFPYASAAYATANRILNFGTNGSGNNQNEIRFNQSGGNQLMYLPQDGVGTAAQINSTTVAAGDTVKLAAGYAVDNFAFARAGSLVGTDTSGTVATTQTHMVIGSRRIANSTDTATAYYRKIAYWPKRLTNTLLEQLTT